MSDIDDLLDRESVKDLVDKVVADIENTQGIVIAYTLKDGTLRWKSNCKRSEGLGLLDVVHYDMLIGDVEAEE